ncbi:MAG: DUF4169 family protein [Pseudomonadota bacterium]|uniref:DUF4169 family protein n=1 Tax=Roseovarius TaxID=74030 RepID=UPI0022A8B1F5|nr:DUF4169 family protein [Roseovarius sp. EGI FJ00037]MCZ0813969.1 DUF4169 family protein [Roseovarius sp. EGI FJ00037]
MSKVINLNQVRKQKARTAKRAKADQNAARHGRKKADRALDAAQSDKALQDHEAHKRDEDE